MNITLKENETMQDLVDRLTQSFELVCDVAPVAYWYENLYENGRIKDIHFSKRMREMLGYKSIEEFPDELNTLMTFTHPDDVHIMLDGAIEAGTGKSEKYDVQYRIRKADGTYMWCNATGELVKDSTGRTVGMYGAFVNISDEIEHVKEQELLNEALDDDGVFLIDCVNNTRRTVHDHLAGAKNYQDTEGYTEGFSRYVETCVAEQDRSMMRRYVTLEGLIEATDKEKDIRIKYQDITTGKPINIEMRLVRYSENEVMQSFKNDQSVAVKKVIDSERIIAALSEDFGCVNYVELSDNPKEDKTIGFRTSDLLKELIPGWENENRFSSKLDLLLKNVVYEPDKEQFIHDTRRENILARLKDADMTFSNVRMVVYGEIKYYQFQFSAIREDGRIIGIVAGLHSIDDEVKRELSAQEKIKEAENSEKLVESVASVYRLAFAVDMNGSYFKIIRMDAQVMKDTKFRTFSTYEEAVQPLFKLIHPDDKDRMEHELDFDTIRERIKASSSYSIEYRVLRDGAAEWHEMKVTHISGDEIVMGFGEKDLEITRRHIDNVRFKDYFGLYEADLDTGLLKVIIDSPYYTFSETRKPVPYSPAMKKFAESQKDETKEFFLNLADTEWVSKALSKDDRLAIDYYSITAGNRWVDVTCYVTMRHNDGTPAMFTLGYSFVGSAEAENQEMKRQLKDALYMAEAANRAKTAFLNNMSHDIRTPMNAIKGFTSMANKNLGNDEKVAEYLAKIDTSGQQLLTLINQVLEMSRIESGKVEIENKPVNVRTVYDATITVLTEQAKTSGLTFTHSFENVTHQNILADVARINSILLNITGNAMKYTPKGGSVDFKFKEIDSRKEGYATFVFIVSDTGIGMSPEFLVNLFTPFEREKTSTVSKIQGTGLGMAIVKNLVDLIGGEIEVHSKVGEGTKFDVTLDFEINEKADAVKKANQEVQSVSFAGKKVLLTDDNEFNLEIALDVLQDAALVVETAHDGTEAVQILKEKGPDYYDFVLMDVQMPIMNGYDATKEIRKMYPDSGLPIIALSANAFEEDKQKSLKAGMNDHVTKPIIIDELFRVLAKYL